MIRQACPACNSTARKILVSEPYTSSTMSAYMHHHYRQDERSISRWLGGNDFEVAECECGLCYQTYFPDPDVCSQLYDHWIDNSAGPAQDLRRPSIKAYEPIIQEVVALASYIESANKIPLGEIKLLDYGMGWGSWLRMARAFGIEAYGYEVSPARIKHAASLGIPCLTDSDLSQHKFHIINLEQVLEHVPDPVHLVQRLIPLLSDDGIIKISVPNGAKTSSLLRAHGTRRLSNPEFVPIAPLQHVNSFTQSALTRMVERMGLRVRKAPVLQQFKLLCASSPVSAARSIGRPFIRGVLGVGTSLVVSR